MQRRRGETPDLALAVGVVAAEVLDAARAVDARLGELGVRHALVGGLAVAAHGHPRATRDVDFLVGPEAFDHHAAGFVTMKVGLPVGFAGGVIIDYLLPRDDERFLLDEAFGEGAGAVVPATVLLYLKLNSPRAKDRADVIELLKVGIDVGAVARFLDAHAPQLRPRLDEAIEAARAEDDAG